MSFALLSETAIAALVTSPFIGHYADRLSSKRTLLVGSLVGALFGSIVLALATSSALVLPRILALSTH